jgi:hypothetical protein
MIHGKLYNHQYSNGKPYDPKTFKNPTKGNVNKPKKIRKEKAPDMLDLMMDVLENGYAIIDKRHLEAISSRVRREKIRWHFKTIKGTDKIKVIPAPE